MDSELHFEWPEGGHSPEDDWRPLARRKSARPAKKTAPADEGSLEQQLDQAREAIARLEADRRTARTMIEDLEQANDELHTRVTSQRRRLLLLERQLEDVEVQPAFESESKTSWLDRLFGGLHSVPAG